MSGSPFIEALTSVVGPKSTRVFLSADHQLNWLVELGYRYGDSGRLRFWGHTFGEVSRVSTLENQ